MKVCFWTKLISFHATILECLRYHCGFSRGLGARAQFMHPNIFKQIFFSGLAFHTHLKRSFEGFRKRCSGWNFFETPTYLFRVGVQKRKISNAMTSQIESSLSRSTGNGKHNKDVESSKGLKYVYIIDYCRMKFKRSILLWRNRIAFNGIAEPFCKENTF